MIIIADLKISIARKFSKICMLIYPKNCCLPFECLTEVFNFVVTLCYLDVHIDEVSSFKQ